MVESRFVGMKSRGVFETPGGTVLQTAHRDLEGLTMDRETMRLRDHLIPQDAAMVYNGFWFAPERGALQALVGKAQERVQGSVRLKLYKGAVTVLTARSIPYLNAYKPRGNGGAVDGQRRCIASGLPFHNHILRASAIGSIDKEHDEQRNNQNQVTGEIILAFLNPHFLFSFCAMSNVENLHSVCGIGLSSKARCGRPWISNRLMQCANMAFEKKITSHDSLSLA